MNHIWEIVHRERRSLISDLSRLDAAQWSTPSLCYGWTVHDVLAHLVDDAKTTKVSFFVGLLRAGFNFDRANERGIVRQRRSSPIATLAEFRKVSKRTSSAPAPVASRLVEIIVHGEDIRRPLGIAHEYPVNAVIEAIKYQLATSASMGGSKERAEGLHLGATDTDWYHGSGAVVHARAIDLLMALTGREVPDTALSGTGADLLRSRT